MDKNKKTRSNYNEEILKQLMKKYGFTKSYIQKSIRGDRTGTIPLKIQEEYKALDSETKKVIKTKLDKL